jgi:hypothetical protein
MSLIMYVNDWPHYYQGDQLKEVQTSGTYSIHGEAMGPLRRQRVDGTNKK